MAVRNVPAEKYFVCDCCRVEVPAKGDEKRPNYWAALSVAKLHVGYADDTMSKLLCESCAELTLKAIERVEPAPKKGSDSPFTELRVGR